jgi:hypothetical protein
VQDTSIPPKFPIPWANSAGGSFIRTIPTASQIGIVAGEPSLTDGWVPLNALPVAGGGIPPDIRDQNGILNAITKWQQWQQAGGAIPYDATFQTAIGGYPKNAIVGSAVTAGLFWLATTDNNTTNPDVAGAGWMRWPLTRNGEITAADLAAGVAASNVGALGGVLGGTLPNPTMAAGAAVANIGFTPAHLAGSSVQVFSVANGASGNDALAYGQMHVAQVGQLQVGGVGTTVNAIVSFTTATSGVIHAVGSRVMSIVDTVGNTGTLYINGVTMMSDSCTGGMTHMGSLACGAGSCAVQYTTSGVNPFTSNVGFIFVPTV